MQVQALPVEYQPKQQTLNPVVQGSSIIALYYKGGVIVASDCLLTYGSGMCKFFQAPRIEQINDKILYTFSGELSDFQVLSENLKQLEHKSKILDDGIQLTPKDYWNYLAHQQYEMRNKFDPYMVSNIIAGFQNGQRFLGTVDMFGTKFETNHIVTGMATYICRAIIANYWNPECDENTAKQIIHQCFKVLFYRHSRANDKIQIGIIDQNGIRLEGPVKVETKWDFEAYVNRASEKIHKQ